MKFKGLEIEAAIFDLDGTLIDSTDIWAQIDVNFFTNRGLPVPTDYADQIAHLGLKDAATYTKSKYNLPESEEAIIKEWNDAAFEMYEKEVLLKPYAEEILKFLKSSGIKLAVATANSEDLYMPCLRRLGIDKYFDYILDVNKAKVDKGNVKLYFMINEKLGIDVNKTVVFEDVYKNLKTAHDNGYITIGISDKATQSTKGLKKKYSTIYIDSFEELL